MKKLNAPLVIAIGSVSGGGKTTIVTRLIKQLQYSKALFFDSYDFEGPHDVLKWVDNGADSNEWNLTPLKRDIEEMLPQPLDYIFLDYPFAYQHSQISKFIDVTVFIDTPLDIALARRMIRDFKGSSADEILLQMQHYATQGRRGYLEMLQNIKPDSDLVIDGTLPVNEIANRIAEQVKDI
ncbi:hypothetical protein QWY14_17310 [Planococcus sp. N028]|uniref:Phosphoribulokinase/uridine kinase domain-containing protein n=1 Tax=Planococcus shixiaomingii TaxID=3058393 RepID=A0ABT8N6P3_9BACL|nr:hypothetical protein [Planococcus sp. N028]MDN7243551.1 hypothetical protein [Planococcus sp. N028]